jgi:hypothetical protein
MKVLMKHPLLIVVVLLLLGEQNIQRSASLVVKGEGGINSVNRGNAGDTPDGAKSIFGKNLTDMTVGEIMQDSKRR